MTNEFIIKINKDSAGNELSLENITIETADAFKIFFESLSEIAKSFNDSNIRIAIRNGSVETSLIYSDSEVCISEQITSVIQGTSNNNEKIKMLKNIQDKIKQNGLDYTVIHKVNNECQDLTPLFKSKDFSLRRTKRKIINEHVEFITGKLFECGGKTKTNVHIENSNKEFKVECNRNQAIELNRRLYSDVFLSVVKRIKTGEEPTYELLDSYLSEETFSYYKSFYENVRNDQSFERYDLIYNLIMQNLASDESSNEIRKIMKLFNYPGGDRAIIRVVLMTLQPFLLQNKNLQDLYDSLLLILRQSNSYNVVN